MSFFVGLTSCFGQQNPDSGKVQIDKEKLTELFVLGQVGDLYRSDNQKLQVQLVVQRDSLRKQIYLRQQADSTNIFLSKKIEELEVKLERSQNTISMAKMITALFVCGGIVAWILWKTQGRVITVPFGWIATLFKWAIRLF